VALNAWLFPVHTLRADLTADREYSLSDTTRELIGNLQEPLLIRGYFSERTHPLLSPLVPTIRDLMREYEVLSGGKIAVEIIDPQEDPELEAEASAAYGIRPTPFRIAERYESAVINSYFDILVRYGDQFVTLGFDDLIEIEPRGGNDFDVRLRNLEYDLTRSIKKVVYGFQSLDAVLASIEEPVRLTALVTPATLPATLADVPERVEEAIKELVEASGGQFVFEQIDPDAPGSALTRQSLYENYGLQAFAVSLFSPESYYLHLLLQIGDETQVFYPSGELSKAEIRSEIEATLKRAAPGFLKTVGLWTPPQDPIPTAYGGTTQPPYSWTMVREQLAQNYAVKDVDLSTGRVPGDVDVLLVLGPQGMSDKARFAIDQFLMRGGAVIVAAGRYMLAPEQFGGLYIAPLQESLHDMLERYGVKVGQGVVMDPRNTPFPVQVQRDVGGFSVLEWQEVDYPPFVDVRQNSMATESPILANLSALTLHWASPLELDVEQNQDRDVQVLFESTDQAWLYNSTDMQPKPERYPRYGFPVEGEQAAFPLAVSVRGSFESYFKDQPSPFEQATEAPEEGDLQQETPVLGTIDSSPESARLIVVGSAEFLNDIVLDLSANLGTDRYLLNLQFLQNAVDWAVEDEDLLSIRSRGSYTRLLEPLQESEQSFWEFLNYGLAVLSVIVIGVVWNVRQRSEMPIALVEVSTEQAGGQA
jgi:ABC-2 type transport system permease protein